MGPADLASTVEDSLAKNVVNMILRYKDDDKECISLDCVNSEDVDKTLATLKERGFSDGALPSKDIIVSENEEITLKLTGNVAFEDEDEPVSFPYSSVVNNAHMELYIGVGQKREANRRGYMVYTGNKHEQNNILCKLPVSLLQKTIPHSTHIPGELQKGSFT